MLLYINWGVHFFAFLLLLFVFVLFLKMLFFSKESYQLIIRLSVVVFSFGGELAMTYYPHIFMIDWYNVAFNLGGAICGVYMAQSWLRHRHRDRLYQT